MTKEEMIDRQAAMLKEWAAQVDKLQAQMQAGNEAGRAQMEQQVAALKTQQAAAEAQLAKLRAANEAAYKDMQQGYERMMKDYGEAVKSAWSRFHS
jgi:hypothetical protein